MDLFEELEVMAQNAHVEDEEEPLETTTLRWHNIFGFTSCEATQRIKAFRSLSSFSCISDEHWEMVRQMKEKEGHDRESYAYSYQQHLPGMTCFNQKPVEKNSKKTKSSKYLIKLEGPLGSADALLAAANMSKAPRVLDATDSSGVLCQFCEIDGSEKFAIEAFIHERSLQFRPTFVRYSKAAKNLSASSIYPTLGIDSTLPHHRAVHTRCKPTPAQEQYPVWYFAYGTLADSDTLSKLLGIQPIYMAAKIRGGMLTNWGKYKALVDDYTDKSGVSGKAFRIENSDQEDTLRVYETGHYEVVRCTIEFDAGEHVAGLTFRYIGGAEWS